MAPFFGKVGSEMAMLNLKYLSVAALTMAALFPVKAAVVFTENFDSENGGVASASYTTFANLSLGSGSGPANLTNVGCLTGLFVTLAAPNPTFPDPVFLVSGSFTFNANDTIRVSYFLSGGGGSLPLGSYGFYSGFEFDQPLSWTQAGVSYTNLTETWGPSVTPSDALGRLHTIDASTPFSEQSFYVQPTQAGTVRFRIQLFGLSSPGPTLENVRLEITPASGGPGSEVPEPSSAVALLIGSVCLAAIKRARC